MDGPISSVDGVEHCFQAEVFERSVRSLNNKDVQTDENAALSPSLIRSSEHGIATNEVGDISVASSIQLSSALPTQRLHTPLRPQSVEVDEDVHQEHITHDHMPRLDSNEASLSEATSLPLDPVSVVSPEAVKVVKVDVQSTSNEEQPPADESYDESTGKFVQTDIAQFQVDEIMLKLYNLQNRRQPEVDKCCETSESLDIPKDGAIKKRHTAGLDLLNNIAMQPGKELTDQGILAVDEHQSLNDTVPLVIVSEEPECRSTQTSPFFQNHSIGTDPIEKTNLNDDNVRFLNRSMETDAWMSQIHTPECSRAVQTSFNDLTVTNEELPFPADLNEEKQSNACVDTCDMSVQTQLSMTEMKNERNLIPDRPGPSWIMDSEDDESHCENSKQDLIVQTDDSYLKIARRLDELRSKRTQFLAVYTATPLKDEHRTNSFRRRNRDSLKLWAEKPSDRKGFSLDVLRGSRRSMKRSGGRDAPTTPGVKVTHFHPSGEDIIESSEVTNPSQPSLASNSNKSLQAQREPFEKSRSIPPTFATFPLISSAKLKRKSSSPPKIQPGTVSAFIKFHERGIHNPGTLEGIRAGRTEAIDARKHSCI
ncbi:hypothetical protein AB6A40_005249 [Gnathostoma spinigerum]|uniref:Uncharacterized protein n=1 Tax=Gnathostoma spinigerum TaxID=75299 RepID=A0ABD6EQK6_9BILA